MSRLGTSQAKVARDSGMSSHGSFYQWLNGNKTHTPAVVRVGAKAMQWYEANKSRQPPGPPHKQSAPLKKRPIRHPLEVLYNSLGLYLIAKNKMS